MAAVRLTYGPLPKSWEAVPFKKNITFKNKKTRQTIFWPPGHEGSKPNVGDKWEVRLTEDARLFYVNHSTREVRALPPLDAFLDKYHQHLVDMLPHTIIDALRERDILTEDDIVHIKSFPTSRTQNNELSVVLRKKSRLREADLEAALCDGFCRSNQVCPFVRPNSYREPISQENRTLLRNIRKVLIENFTLETMQPLRNELISAGVLDTELDQIINWETSRREVIDKLLYVIERCHNGIVELFKVAVKTCNEDAIDLESLSQDHYPHHQQ